jgi:hypothetical protein
VHLALQVLLGSSASLSARDRRGRAALDYAPAGTLTYAVHSLQLQIERLIAFYRMILQQAARDGADDFGDSIPKMHQHRGNCWHAATIVT